MILRRGWWSHQILAPVCRITSYKCRSVCIVLVSVRNTDARGLEIVEQLLVKFWIITYSSPWFASNACLEKLVYVKTINHYFVLWAKKVFSKISLSNKNAYISELFLGLRNVNAPGWEKCCVYSVYLLCILSRPLAFPKSLIWTVTARGLAVSLE